MSKDPYDPTRMGLAAGSSSDPLNLGLSDKGAKEFKEATANLEKASRSMGLINLASLFNNMEMVSNNPMLRVFLDWIQAFGSLLNAQFVGLATELQRVLWSEESKERMEDMAEAVGDANDQFESMTDTLKGSQGPLDDFIKGIEKSGYNLNAFVAGPLYWLLANIEAMTKQAQGASAAIVNWIKDIQAWQVEFQLAIASALNNAKAAFKDFIEDLTDDLKDWIEDTFD